MRIFYSILIFFLYTYSSLAQTSAVKGVLNDSLSHPMPSATVLLLNPDDSSLVNFSTSNVTGNFVFKNVRPGKHLLRISYVGYNSYFRLIETFPASQETDLGIIKLEAGSTRLNELTITAGKAPVTVKHDTIEFNAPSFKTQPNANVEDLLKKMPGFDVKPDGKVIAQGEEVKKITVEGKPFFGNDPTLATRNLPADAINKVQLYNRKSDQSLFTGIDDGQRKKAINLELKEDRKNGFFGTAMGGAGTEERYKGKTNINRFTKRSQLSLLGMAGNTNEQGFSMDDYMNFTGGMQNISGGGAMVMQFSIEDGNMNGVPIDMGKNTANGIMTSYAGGVNTNNMIGKNTEVNASYFGNYLNHDHKKTTDRENFFPTGNSLFLQKDTTDNHNSNHRLNLVVDQKIDSFNTFKLTTGFSINKTDVHEKVDGSNFIGDIKQNESKRTLSASGENMNLQPELLFRHNFRKKGRTFSADIRLGFNEEDNKGKLDAVNNFYVDSTWSQIQDQRNLKSNAYQNYDATLSYTDRIGKGKYIEARYHYGLNRSNVEQDVYDIVNESESLNTKLSSKYRSDYSYSNYGLNFRYVKRSYNILVGGSLQQTGLNGNLELQGINIRRNYTSILPVARFNYDFTTSRHLNIEYTTRVEEPTLQQLQPVVNNTDPLNIYSGNPSLNPAYNHNWRINYNSFSPTSFFSFFGLAEVNYKTNAITNSQNIDEKSVRTIMPVNVRNNLSGWTNLDVGIPVKKLSGRFNIGSTIREDRGISMINGAENTIKTGSIAGNLSYNFDYKDFLQLFVRAEIISNYSKYQFNQPDQKFLNNTFSAGSTYKFLKRFLINANFDYLIFNNQSSGYRQNIPLLDLYASVFLFRYTRGELRFSVSNLLDKSIGIIQSATQNYIETNTTNALGRYFMISFTYALNRPLVPEGGMHGNFIKIIR